MYKDRMKNETGVENMRVGYGRIVTLSNEWNGFKQRI